jgi:diadenosine tetraphosphate (Ap4A) HIT family hydrolase
MDLLDDCAICERVKKAMAGLYPGLIYEFPNSFFVVGDHQYHKGYCLLFLKYHVRELHELSAERQTALFQELMAATGAIVKTFRPWKMNHACYGNVDEHVHWHLIPRYEERGDHRTNPWLHATEFGKHMIDDGDAARIAAELRKNMAGGPLL